MTNDLGGDITGLETRLNVVEQQGVVARTPSISVVVGAGGVPTVRDSLTFDAGWIQHTQIKIGQPNPALPNYPSISWMHHQGGYTPYGPAQAVRVGPMCFLTGVVVRTGSTIPSGGGNGVRMFMLPTGWRPKFSAMLPCITDGASPGIAWIDVRPDTSSPAGGVYFQVGTGTLPAGTGWIHLAGAFPCADAPLP